MKRQVFSVFALFCMLISLCGCGSLGSRPASLGDSIALSGDGVVSSEILGELKQKNQVVKFCGTSGGLDYEWTVFGSEIKGTDDLSLGIEITKATNTEIAFRFLSMRDFGFSPVLSIILKDGWAAGSGAVYRVTESGESRSGGAVLTVKDACILTFTPTGQTGDFVIRAEDAENEADVSESPPPEESKQTTASNSAEQTQTPEDPETESHTTSMPQETEKTSEPEIGTTSVPQETETSSRPEETVNPPQSESVPDETQPQKKYTCILSIECISVLNHLDDLDPDKLDVLPKDGILFAAQEVEFKEGESVYDMLLRVCKEKKIPLEASFTPMYNSTYVEGIGNLYEFDCGPGSGWMYCVDGWYPNYGCSLYTLKDGQTVQWRYTCDLGGDIGGANALAG